MKSGIRKAGNAGLVTTLGGAVAVVCHTLVLNAGVSNERSAVIRKIMAYNNTGGDATITFGTMDRQAVPAFVALFPALVLINTFDAEFNERDIPAVEFQSNMGLLAAGRSGDIMVLGSVAGITVIIEVEEFGA